MQRYEPTFDLAAVDGDVAVVDELASRKRGRHELGAVDDGVETGLEQADQRLRGVATQTDGLFVNLVELLLAEVTVVTLQLLLGAQLQTVVRGLALAALAVLAGAVFTLVDRALGATPEVLAHTAVDLVLCTMALRHRVSRFLSVFIQDARPPLLRSGPKATRNRQGNTARGSVPHGTRETATPAPRYQGTGGLRG